MATHTFELRLTGFDYPPALPNDKANFRIAADVRYVDPDGTFTTDHVVMPGLDTYWECATDKSGDPNFVRSEQGAFFDMAKIDAWDSLILVFRASEVHSVNLVVFDVNRRDPWDDIKDQVGPLIEAAIGKAANLVPALPVGIAGKLGDAAEDVRAYVLKKLAGGDEILFKKSATLTAMPGPQALEQTISGRGVAGNYAVKVSLKVLAGAPVGV
jgi:hypothetical protein